MRYVSGESVRFETMHVQSVCVQTVSSVVVCCIPLSPAP